MRKADPLPYVPGLEVVGDVIEVGGAVDGVRAGDRVIAMMQGLGGARTARGGRRVLLVPTLALFKALPEPPAGGYLGE